MPKFSLNPLRWLKDKQPSQSSKSMSSPVLKPRAQPRKSGNLFMHLITLQKSVQSMELALKQGIDSIWLVQKAASQASLLKMEAGTVGEEEVSEAAGQMLEYFETVSEGRLELDSEGVGAIRDLLIAFKDVIGDAAPGVRTLDFEQVALWNKRYQALMAQMKPIESLEFLKLDDALEEEKPEDEEPVQEADSKLEAETLTPEEEESVVSKEEAAEETTAFEHDEQAISEVEESEEIGFPGVREFASSVVPEGSDGDEQSDVEGPEPVSEENLEEELAVYDPADELSVRDVVISDSEIKSAREFMELGEPKPQLDFEDEGESEETPGAASAQPSNAENGASGVKSPVRLEEVERLKRKLLELHEKQEMLSSRMSGILGGLREAVQPAKRTEGAVSVEELDVDELEDIIFIGRKKG